MIERLQITSLIRTVKRAAIVAVAISLAHVALIGENSAALDIEKAKEHYRKKEYREALSLFERSADRQPSWAGYFLWGNCHFHLKEFRAAIPKYRLAAKYNAKEPAIFSNWGAALFAVRKFDKAAKAFEKVSRIEKDENWETYLSWGKSLFNAGRYSESLPIFKKSMALSKPCYHACMAVGANLVRLGRNREAQIALKETLLRYPFDLNLITEYGYSLELEGDLNGALLHYNFAIELDREWPQAYRHRAHIKAAQGDNQGALADIEKAVRINPDNGDFYKSWGKILENAGMKTKAAKKLKKAREMGSYVHQLGFQGNGRTELPVEITLVLEDCDLSIESERRLLKRNQELIDLEIAMEATTITPEEFVNQKRRFSHPLEFNFYADHNREEDLLLAKFLIRMKDRLIKIGASKVSKGIVGIRNENPGSGCAMLNVLEVTVINYGSGEVPCPPFGNGTTREFTTWRNWSLHEGEWYLSAVESKESAEFIIEYDHGRHKRNRKNCPVGYE